MNKIYTMSPFQHLFGIVTSTALDAIHTMAYGARGVYYMV